MSANLQQHDIKKLHTCRTSFPGHLWLSAVHRPGCPRTAIVPRRGKWRTSSIGSGLREFAARYLVPHQFQLLPSFVPHEITAYSPRILLLAFGSQEAWRLLDVPAKCTMGSLVPRKFLQSSPSSSSSSLLPSVGCSIFVTCHLTRISRIATHCKRISK